ncbi:hypothetical protein [Roseococcus sp.]|uniref:hypothetical protein n=1 Tax=Roseococcus sp. TaxID=2109646 RepID=UPI003BAA0E84
MLMRLLADVALAGEVGMRAGIEAGAKVCNARGIDEQEAFGLGRGAQNYYRARDAIRALTPPPSDALAAMLKAAEERGAAREREAITRLIHGFHYWQGSNDLADRQTKAWLNDAIRARAPAGGEVGS